jgi:hypothetical protein
MCQAIVVEIYGKATPQNEINWQITSRSILFVHACLRNSVVQECVDE